MLHRPVELADLTSSYRVIDWVLRVLGVKRQLRAVRHLVVYPSEDFPSSDVHREALVGRLLSPFF